MIFENNSPHISPDIKLNRELLISNEYTDVLSPSKAITDITAVVCSLLEDNLSYVAKNGLSEKAKVNREKLLKLLYTTELINTVANQNLTLKLYNKQLIYELAEIKRQEKLANTI